MAGMIVRTPSPEGRSARLRAFVLLLLSAVLVSGCQLRTDAELAKEEEIRQKTADAAASIFEAVVALENGVPLPIPASAIKITCATIIQSNGRQYAPADAYLKSVTKPTGGAP